MKIWRCLPMGSLPRVHLRIQGRPLMSLWRIVWQIMMAMDTQDLEHLGVLTLNCLTLMVTVGMEMPWKYTRMVCWPIRLPIKISTVYPSIVVVNTIMWPSAQIQRHRHWSFTSQMVRLIPRCRLKCSIVQVLYFSPVQVVARLIWLWMVWRTRMAIWFTLDPFHKEMTATIQIQPWVWKTMMVMVFLLVLQIVMTTIHSTQALLLKIAMMVKTMIVMVWQIRKTMIVWNWTVQMV